MLTTTAVTMMSLQTAELGLSHEEHVKIVRQVAWAHGTRAVASMAGKRRPIGADRKVELIGPEKNVGKRLVRGAEKAVREAMSLAPCEVLSTDLQGASSK